MSVKAPEERGGLPAQASDEVHVPVLFTEVLDAVESGLGVEASGLFVDGTAGSGRHAAGVLQRMPNLRLLGLDWDPDSLAIATGALESFGDRAQLRRSALSQLDENLSAWIGQELEGPVLGVLVDLGVCSLHFDRPERGFSLMADGPLDMRMSPGLEHTAADLVNTLSEERLADIFYHEGGERRSRRAAAAVVAGRRRTPFKRTLALAECIAQALGHSGKTHPATRVFQALRREVNGEGQELVAALDAAEKHLEPGGLLLAITFHSGEDGEVKRRFASAAREGRFEVLTPKPIGPERAEVRRNPRARSARLRVARRLREAPRDGVGEECTQ